MFSTKPLLPLLCLPLFLSSPALAQEADGASQVPANVGFFGVLSGGPDLDINKVNFLPVETFQEMTGFTPSAMAQWARPGGYLALLPAPGAKAIFKLPRLTGSDAAEDLTYCKSNLKNIATAMEMYSTDNSGRYPKKMAQLTPSYLKTIPLCPSAHTDTYSNSLEISTSPDAYTFYCAGHHHPQETVNFPQYNSYSGLNSGSASQREAPEQHPLLVIGIRLSDETLARKQFTEKFGEPKKIIDGVAFWESKGDFSCIHEGFLLTMNTPEAAAAVVATWNGKSPNLATQADFKACRTKFPAHEGLFFYLPMQQFASKDTPPMLDAFTYFGGVAYNEGGHFQSSMQLAFNSQSKLTQMLTKVSPIVFQSGSFFPPDWGIYSGLNLRYPMEHLGELVTSLPQATEPYRNARVALKSFLSFDLENQLASLFTGEVAVSSNAMTAFPQSVARGFQKARGAGQRISCSNNLKNIATSLEMYATDHKGHYPKKLAGLTPSYLKTIPECPLTHSDTYSHDYQVSLKPDAFTLTCSNLHNGSKLSYSSIQGLINPLPEEARHTWADKPTMVMALGIRDIAQARQILGAAGLQTLPSGVVSGDFSPASETGIPPVSARLLENPSPVLILAVGFEATAMANRVVDGKLAFTVSENGKRAWPADSARLVSQGYADLAPFLHESEKIMGNDVGSQMILHSILTGASTSYAVNVEDAGYLISTISDRKFDVEGSLATAALLVPNFVKARAQGQLTACKSNLKNEATALEMWSTDHNGRYPSKMSELVPDYLRYIPECPAAGADTYSATYQKSEKPDAYTFFCCGSHHQKADVPSNFPQYNSYEGLKSTP